MQVNQINVFMPSALLTSNRILKSKFTTNGFIDK